MVRLPLTYYKKDNITYINIFLALIL